MKLVELFLKKYKNVIQPTQNWIHRHESFFIQRTKGTRHAFISHLPLAIPFCTSRPSVNHPNKADANGTKINGSQIIVFQV